MLSPILASSLALAPRAFPQHCFDCHGDGASKAGPVRDEVLVDRRVDDADAWLALRARLRSHDMPPDDWDRPSNDGYDAMLSWVDDRTRQLADEAVKLELRIDGVRNDVIEVNEVRPTPGSTPPGSRR